MATITVNGENLEVRLIEVELSKLQLLRREVVYRFVMKETNITQYSTIGILTRHAERAIFRYEALVTMQSHSSE